MKSSDMDADQFIILHMKDDETKSTEKLEDKIEQIIFEFGDNPNDALSVIAEHIQLERHARRNKIKPEPLANSSIKFQGGNMSVGFKDENDEIQYIAQQQKQKEI